MTDNTRDVAVTMLRAGTATIAEVAWLANASHQRVSYWAKRAGIDVHKSRERHLLGEWRALRKTRPGPAASQQ